MKKQSVLFLLLFFAAYQIISAQNCIDCHTKVTPNIVKDWQLSKHSKNDVDCSTCHGDQHTTMDDFAKAELPTYETCNDCHDEQVEQFLAGKHSKGWAALMAMPTIHMQPSPLIEGEKGCGACHKIGVKSPEEVKKLKESGSMYGHASCDACHTRHTFSVKEAKQPQACQTCHMGFDHPQWEMYTSSKHGVRALLKQNGTLPEDTPAPTCQDCHMSEGNHSVRTAWGFLALRLPLPEDKQWAADRVTILQALGVLDPDGKPTAILDVVKAADIVRLTQEDWQNERDKMVKVCSNCHAKTFAEGELKKGDEMIMHADRLMAEAIRVVADLYKDGIIKKPESYAYAFPQMLTFHDAPTVIEQKLFVMFLEHRMRTFQGTFHASPDYALWYGWSEMVRDLTEVKELAEQMRINKSIKK
ncbi:MAG: cytochrome C [Chlorobi bacterium]|nr:cytochrome C [Chlorobiota bacterium]